MACKARGGKSRKDVSRRKFLATSSSIAALATSGIYAQPKNLVAAPNRGDVMLPGFGKAKSVIIFYLYGAPPQMETLDPKPDSPSVKEGGIKSIPSSIPGIHVADLLPEIGKRLHNFALIRSMSHSSNNHAVSVALSGLSKSVPAIEANGQDKRHAPYIGSVLEFLLKQQGVDASVTGVPVHMLLPWRLNLNSDPGRWSPNADYLGREYDPIIPQFIGEGSLEKGLPTQRSTKAVLSRFNPFHGITPESTFRFKGTKLPEDVSEERLTERRGLLKRLDENDPGFLGDAEALAFNRSQEVAFNMITHPKVAHAVDFTREPMAIREKYGMHLLGQQLLAARRLVEAGVKMVTCIWDDWSSGNQAWDTHSNHFARIKHNLCPLFDQMLPVFYDDLEQHGLLDDTLVMVLTEHGRTPHLNDAKDSGRDHWSGAYWELFFGAGIKTDRVIGATDKLGAYPITKPYDPKDVLATMYHLLGFDPQTTEIPDRVDRGIPILPHGDVIRELVV